MMKIYLIVTMSTVNIQLYNFVHVNISSASINLRNFELFLSNRKHNLLIICRSYKLDVKWDISETNLNQVQF